MAFPNSIYRVTKKSGNRSIDWLDIY